MDAHRRMLQSIPAFRAYADASPQALRKLAQHLGLPGLTLDMSAKFRFSQVPRTVSENWMMCA